MTRTLRSGFSLIEITLALGVTSFCLLAILGLFSVGLRAGQQARDYTTIAGASSLVMSRVQASSTEGFPFPSTLFFDAHGQVTNSNAALYVCDITKTTVSESVLPAVSTNLGLITMRFTWPASLAASARKNTNVIYATQP